ncbi:hypothetical protein O6H91_21G023900 [Diphasiastrum complanatum]|uniref:Uncharacterized protein n=1 Tax=Diphasiastrum complanatum TaxID=34168 RepID=A0ACC2AJZ1_DIPCM|nr:hypothetical protein O6H91_21G023900 [Diphasiastrum complanatum]
MEGRFSSLAASGLLFLLVLCCGTRVLAAPASFAKTAVSSCNLLELVSCFPSAIGAYSRAQCCQAMDDILAGCLCTNTSGGTPVQFEVKFRFASDCQLVIPVGVPCS